MESTAAADTRFADLSICDEFSEYNLGVSFVADSFRAAANLLPVTVVDQKYRVRMNQTDIRERLANVQRVKSMSLSLDSHHYITLSYLYDWLKNTAIHAARGTILDYGCGGQPYRELFSSKAQQYIGADVAAAADTAPDLTFLPGERLTLADESIDTILSTQVLEHVAEHDSYLAECRRLLKPGGRLLITVPMQWRHHEVPFDYFRYTRFGITHCLVKYGFAIEDLKPCGGVYALIGQIFASHLAERGVDHKWTFRLINRLALWLDKKYPDYEDTLAWLCIARKV